MMVLSEKKVQKMEEKALDLLDKKEKKVKPSKRAKKLAKLIKGKFGCAEESVRRLIEEVIEEDIPTKKNILKDGMVVHIKSNINHHDYDIDSKVLITESDVSNDRARAMNIDGSTGNWLCSLEVQMATEEEIKKFFKKFRKKHF